MIDTIFYFATTMDEYRNLVEEQQISARTIVFVEETQEIYKNGKLYPDISGVKKAINNASTKSWQDTVRAIGELNNELREAFNASITDTNASLAEAQSKINEVRTKLSTLTDNEGNALIDVDKANGLIELFAEYWNVDNQTYTNFENIWNAQAGKAGLTAEFVDTVNEKVNEFQSIVDIVNGRKDEWVKSTDINGNIVTKVGQLMSAEGGILRNYVTTTQVNPDQFSTIYNEMNLAKGTYESINARLNNNEQIVAGWQSQVDGFSATAQQFSEFLEGDEYAFLSSLKTYANGDESYFDLTAAKILGALDEDNENKVAAKIFGYVKNNVSNLELTADNIQIGENVTLTDELSTIKGKLLVDGNVTAKAVVVGTNPQILINSTDGIKHTGGKFQINMDGSGFFGNESSKISWTPDGAITATGINIVGSSNVPEGWEDLVNTVSKLDGYSYLGNNGITFANNNDTIILSLADGLKHYKTANNTKSGYNLKNDGSGYVANGLIWWDAEGHTNIGSGANGLSWDENGNVTVGANLIVEGPDYSQEFSDIDDALTALKAYNKARAYVTDSGIIIDNQDTLNRITLATTNVGLLHQYLESYEENGETKYRVKTTQPISAYGFYNDGHGYVANGIIAWNVDGSGSIGTGDKKITWTSNGELVLGSGLIVGGDTTVVENPYDDTEIVSALQDLQGYNDERAYLKNTGILFENKTDGNLVGLTSVNPIDGTSVGGLIHTYIDANGNATTNPPTHGYALYNDGTGSLADGYITWGIDTVDGQKKAWMKINGDEVKITYVNNNTEVVKPFQEYIHDKINLDPYITNDELQSALNGVLKTGDLDGYLNSESLKTNSWLLQQIENLQGQIDVLDPNGESVDVNAIVEAYLQNNLTNEVNEVLGNTLNNYVLNETLQTTLSGYATKGELPDLTGYMKTDSLNMDFAIVAENKNYDPDDSNVEEKQHYLTDPQYVSTEGNYTNDLEKALKVTIAEMLSKIDKLAAYFVDENDKVHLLSSIGIDTQIHDYLTNDTAYSGLINWANGILGGVKSAGFTLNAFIAALSGSVWNEQTQKWESPTGINEDTKEEVNITGIVNKFNSELRLDASQIVTGADGTNSSNVSLIAKLSDINDALNAKAAASVVTEVSNRVGTLENANFLTENDVSDNIIDYLKAANILDNDGKVVDSLLKEDYVLKAVYDEALAEMKSKINEASSSIVSKTTQLQILRRNELLDKELNETITQQEQEELDQIRQDLKDLKDILEDSTYVGYIESRSLLLAKDELTIEEQNALDQYNNWLSTYDDLVDKYGDKPELYNNYLESIVYNYITTSNTIKSAIDDEVASIETLVTKSPKLDGNGNPVLDSNNNPIYDLQSQVNISADQVNINNMTLTNKLATIEGNLLVDGEVAAKSLHSTQNGYHVEIQNGIIEGYKKESENDTPISIYKFDNDGSGHIGSNFSWDSIGNVTLTGLIAESVQTSSNDFHVDIMNGYIKGYVTGNEDSPLYLFNNDGTGFFGVPNNINGENVYPFSWNEDGAVTIGGWTVDGSGISTINNTEQDYYAIALSSSYPYDLGLFIQSRKLSEPNGLRLNITPQDGLKIDQVILGQQNEEITATQLNIDGSGILASGNISWTTDGDINFGDLITINHIGAANHDIIELSEDAIIIWNQPGDLTANTMSQLQFEINGDSYDSYTGTLNIGGQTLLFINGILVQQ